MGTDAKRYLNDHSIPQLFEGLITGLIHNKPDDPLEFIDRAIASIRSDPNVVLTWNMFIENPPSSKKLAVHRLAEDNAVSESSPKSQRSDRSSRRKNTDGVGKENHPGVGEKHTTKSTTLVRVPSVMKAADHAQIPNVPIILFMGGPGGGKTRHAARVQNWLADRGLVHICMPDLVRVAIAKYRDQYPEWKEAADKYERGELIPNNLALALLKAEMGRRPNASAFFLEGYPRESRQVIDFERDIRRVNMAIILDYDEETLRGHMERRGLPDAVISSKIKEFKSKTLPSAKYFDDRKMLHLIAGEQDDDKIYHEMRALVLQAMDSGVQPEVDDSNAQMALSNAQAEELPLSSAPAVAIPSTPIPIAPTPITDNAVIVDQGNTTSPVQGLEVMQGLPNDAPVLLVIGAPGSNKTMYAQRIAKKYDGFVFVGMGEILRRKVQQNTQDDAWKRVERKMDAGEPVPMKVCRKALYSSLAELSNPNWGYVFEGYPRTQQQLFDFEKTIGRLDMALLIDCTEQFCLENIKRRGSKSNQESRPDDRADIVKIRLGLFKQNALPMLKYLDDKGKLKVLDGDSAEEKIFHEICAIIDNTLFIEQDNGSGKSLESSKNGSLAE